MPVEMYPLPGPKRPVCIRYVVISVPILELSPVLCTGGGGGGEVVNRDARFSHIISQGAIPGV